MKPFCCLSSLNKPASAAILVLRLVAGIAFMLHGWMKIQHPFSWMGPEAPVPGLLQGLAAFSEFFGGFAWVIGLLTPIASLGIFCTMTVAVYMHASKGDPFVGMGASYEPALVYLAISLALIFVGPGRFSLDALLFGKEKKT